MPGGIFINYRRALNLKDAQLLQKALRRQFGRRGVFLDVSGLDGGDHWLHTLERQVDASAAMVALIGPGWAEAADEKGHRRLDNPNDFVRFELARALSRSIPVLPVLIDGAAMPEPAQLPTNLLPLTFPQAMPLRGQSLDDDAEKIARRLRHLISQSRRRSVSYPLALAGLLVALALGAAVGPMLLRALGLPVPGIDWPDAEGLRAELTVINRSFDAATKARDEAMEQVKSAKADAEDARKRLAETERSLKDVREQLASKRAASESELTKQLQEIRGEVAALHAQVKGAAKGKDPAPAVKPGSKQSFRDCNDICPEMVVVPAGNFMTGEGADAHEVEIEQPFAVGKFEVTFEEWDACATERGCKHRPDDAGWGRMQRPAINVSWYDAKDYVAWLSRKTGKRYRLLSEAEWEYAARAGTKTAYSWGDQIGSGNANCYGCGHEWNGSQTAPVGMFRPNTWGLHDMHGNVWEWTEDNWRADYKDAPQNGAAWTGGSLPFRVLRGGSWNVVPGGLRSAVRIRGNPNDRTDYFGFRVARSL